MSSSVGEFNWLLVRVLQTINEVSIPKEIKNLTGSITVGYINRRTLTKEFTMIIKIKYSNSNIEKENTKLKAPTPWPTNHVPYESSLIISLTVMRFSTQKACATRAHKSPCPQINTHILLLQPIPNYTN